MAKDRKLNKIDPIRRNQISNLMRTSSPDETYAGEFRRGQEYVEKTTQRETILRWFRVLPNDEAVAAAQAGMIPEPALADNNLKKRSIIPCGGVSGVEEPAPSMWAIEQTRYNCQVVYRDRNQRYELLRFPSISASGTTLTTIGNAFKDNRVLCWFNPNSGHWETEASGTTPTSTPPPPGTANVTFVSIDRTTGGANQCDFQQYNADCLWPGYKLVVDAEADLCSTTTEYSNGDPVWVVGIEGCIKIHKLDLREKYLALKIADALDVEGDIRELWGIRPDYDHPMEWIFVSQSLAFEWQDVAANCIYNGSRNLTGLTHKERAKLRRTSIPIDPCVAAMAVGEFAEPIYCIEVNNRPFVKNRVYLGWKDSEEFEIAGVKHALFYFDSTFPPQQIVRYIGSDTITTLNTVPLNLSPSKLGGIAGVERDVGLPSEIEFAHPGRYRVDVTLEVTPASGSIIQLVATLQWWQNDIASWIPHDELRATSWDSDDANVWDSSSITTIVDIELNDKLRLMVQNPSALRVVVVNRATITIESVYEEAE